MNHLCGCYDGDSVSGMLMEGEAEPLAFRASYMARRR